VCTRCASQFKNYSSSVPMDFLTLWFVVFAVGVFCAYHDECLKLLKFVQI
jgi:hypothetical protein